MMKQLLGEVLIIATGTLFLFALAATVGIPNAEERASTAVAAEDFEPGQGGSSFHETRFQSEAGWER